MKTFNLKKTAKQSYTITDKTIEENRNEMNISNSKQGVVEKNINLSLPTKDKDNTVPFNAQLEAERKNETEQPITEASMDQKEVDFSSKDKKQVMDINVETQKYDDEKTAAFKNSQEKKDTEYWDKYVGVQLEGDMKNVDNNIPASSSQLGNKPERFKDGDIDKLVMASLKDADAMLFHIYATAAHQDRKLNEEEEQQIVDINSGKMRLLAQMVEPVRRSLEYGTKTPDPKIRRNQDGSADVIEQDGTKVDTLKSCEDAKANYPEGEIESE